MPYEGLQNPASIWARAAGSAGRIPMTPPVVPDPNATTQAGLGPLRPAVKPPAAGLNEGGASTASPFSNASLMQMFGLAPKSNKPFNLNTWFNDKMKQQQAAAPAAPAPAVPNKYDRASTLLGIGADLL